MTITQPLGSSATPDFAAVTNRQQQIWATGDFNVIAMNVIGASEQLVADIDPRPGERVLDIACGSGNAALIAARRYCDVVGIDYVPELVARARQRGAADGVPADFREGDAQALPCRDGEFAVILSVFGVMFAPDQERAASELLRVCRRGGRIGLASWMPDGWGGEFFKAVSQHLPPPPPGLKPPNRWGTEQGIRELIGDGITDVRFEKKTVTQHFRSVDHALDTFFTYFGPTARAYAAADDAGRAAMRKGIGGVFEKYNEGKNGACMMRCGYMQVIATRA